MPAPAIVLFTDFGAEGPYVGQMKAAILGVAPEARIIDLMHDAPRRDPKASAYLLAALVDPFPQGSVFLCVVDPGVGGERAPVVALAGGRWFVGPGNGLFEIVARRAGEAFYWRITWRPPALAATFHGRDLFAPVAAMLARGDPPPGEEWSAASDPRRRPGSDWPDDLHAIVYEDRFGNLMTGVRGALVPAGARIEAAGLRFRMARTFPDVGEREAFWFTNSLGLVEIAVNRGEASGLPGLAPGVDIQVIG